VTDYEEWKERYGKKTSAERVKQLLDDLFEQFDSTPEAPESSRPRDDKEADHD